MQQEDFLKLRTENLAARKLDRYELLCPIASGGMASVWLARLRGKRGFEKLFAVKTIKTELIADPHFQEMFLDEARIASRIVHPNVAQILELTGGRPAVPGAARNSLGVAMVAMAHSVEPYML